MEDPILFYLESAFPAHGRETHPAIVAYATLLARVAELEAEVVTLRAHRCEVGLENPDAFIAHLRSMTPEESEALRNAVNPRY